MAEALSVIRWEDPPPPSGSGRPPVPTVRYQAMADELRARPGVWAVVEEKELPTSSLGQRIRMGAVGPFAPCGDFEAVSRRVDGKTVVYARYVGGGEDW